MDREPQMDDWIRLLSKSDVERLLDMRSCIDGVENAFRLKGEGRPSPGGILGVHVPGGGFHAKAAFLELSRPYFAAKVNANFPENPSRHGLPTIQGVLVLFDASNGRPLAVMDSMAITTLRTAAASAVAASFLARRAARIATFVGCGVQARAHVAAISAVRKLDKVFAFDLDTARSTAFVKEMQMLHAFEILMATDLGDATRASDIVVTTTSAKRAFLGRAGLASGAFVAAVGADSEHKQEIEVDLFRTSGIVVDDLEQCATIGDLHHALDAGVIARGDVRATLAEIVAGVKPGRVSEDEIIIFDSTGIAIEDVAAASIVFERAVADDAGLVVQLASADR
jgi:ornithine cyclodeaminase/alanine dehydrogenase-like protein (mu-crystallin family)